MLYKIKGLELSQHSGKKDPNQRYFTEKSLFNKKQWQCDSVFTIAIKLVPYQPIFAVLAFTINKQTEGNNKLLELIRCLAKSSSANLIDVNSSELFNVIDINKEVIDCEDFSPEIEKKAIIKRLNEKFKDYFKELENDLSFKFTEVVNITHLRNIDLFSGTSSAVSELNLFHKNMNNKIANLNPETKAKLTQRLNYLKMFVEKNNVQTIPTDLL